jgi:drug/metabolite transporter (DMT)-like permease
MVLVTVSLWGILPIILKLGLNYYSVGTIAWFRFFFSFVVLFWFLFKFRSGCRILRHPPIMGILGGAALAANYFGMTQGIHLSGASNAAIIIQVAPLLLVIVGVLFFKEIIRLRQLIGIAIAIIGFCLFYLDRVGNAVNNPSFSAANGWILIAAVVWVLYMVCQKQLSIKYSAQSINLLVYAIAMVILIPMVEWGEFFKGGAVGWFLLIALGLNTLLAYGALAEAVECIPLSLISILITLNPLITLSGMWVLTSLFGVEALSAENISWHGYLGGLIAVSGVILVVASSRNKVNLD